MAVSAIENISASGGKIFLQGKNENASSDAENIYGMSETSGRLARSSYKSLVCYKKIITQNDIFIHEGIARFLISTGVIEYCEIQIW